MHYEQRWLDLVPALFGDVYVLLDPAYHVGHWNLRDRAVTVVDDVVFVNRERCRRSRPDGAGPLDVADARRVDTC
jgi:hypothetical protein